MPQSIRGKISIYKPIGTPTHVNLRMHALGGVWGEKLEWRIIKSYLLDLTVSGEGIIKYYRWIIVGDVGDLFEYLIF